MTASIKVFDNSSAWQQKARLVKYHEIKEFYHDRDESDNNGKEMETEHKLIHLNEEVKKIQSLDQLIQLSQQPSYLFEADYLTDLINLKKIQPALEQLNHLIGMKQLKQDIIYQVLYYCQHFNHLHDDLMHTVIQGGPGAGKTTVAKLLAQIYYQLGIIKTDKFVVAKREELIGNVLGDTAIKTGAKLRSALNGVLFIDEAYALGNEEKRDIFSKECIDTINQFLTDHNQEIIVIIAGYEDQLKKCFFAYNQGLERRFPWVYTIEHYTDVEIRQIFLQQLKESGWQLADTEDKIVPLKVITSHMDLFEYGGGDTRNFLKKCLLVHSQHTFGLQPSVKDKITSQDILIGLERHKLSRGQIQKKTKTPFGMYS